MQPVVVRNFCSRGQLRGGEQVGAMYPIPRPNNAWRLMK
jgi:hypothetical protein